MHPLAIPRARAYLRDCGTYLGLAAATASLAVVGRITGWGRKPSFVYTVSSIPPLLAALLAARREARDGTTPGKRRHRLLLTKRTGVPVTFGRALARNGLKIAVPWQLGHMVAIGAASGGFDRRDPLTLGAASVTYPLLAAMIAGAVLGDGRTIHDRLSGTRVVGTATAGPSSITPSAPPRTSSRG